MRAALFLIMLLAIPGVNAQPFQVQLTITESFLELFTGPGSEYRIEHVLLQGEQAVVSKQNADWFYLTAGESRQGWAQLNSLLDNRVQTLDMSFDEFLIEFEGELQFDLSFKTGFIQDDFFMGLEIGHHFDEDMRFALGARQVPGKISETFLFSGDIDYFFSPVIDVLPFFTIGFGFLQNQPADQVIGGETVDSEFWKFGLGVVFAQSKRISFNAAYYQYQPTDDVFEKNLQELSVGLSYFY